MLDRRSLGLQVDRVRIVQRAHRVREAQQERCPFLALAQARFQHAPAGRVARDAHDLFDRPVLGQHGAPAELEIGARAGRAREIDLVLDGDAGAEDGVEMAVQARSDARDEREGAAADRRDASTDRRSAADDRQRRRDERKTP